ncbi:C39 family peptidase [Domibacillus enclensis]|uniref:Peptidase_C39 like family protein n=1 Tax=Domibacillus enclensis TaxID=1017273 RepID=A0A1N6U3I6_9BACI|nr:C39 family peptidase [Domibacillus enclensis]OXS78424.1 hypothetical protein B1B05_07375 [Domibacillus enclensis]SIQ60097.1 Peptidase_C39 like family protein [Domibacillus enclensis]
MIKVKGQSQYAETVDERYRRSACGPVTISVILHFWNKPLDANDLYKQLGTTKIGSFRFWMSRKLKKLLGSDWTVKPSNRIDEVLNELDSGHPVAAKFDRYFTLRFFSKPRYNYHWVVLIGYEIKDGTLYLYYHDNGAPGRKSSIQRVSFEDQAPFLRFLLLSRKYPPAS